MSRTGPEQRAHIIVQRLLKESQERPDRFRTRSDMAREAQLSISHFTRVFQMITRITPQAFLDSKRKRQAEKLLGNPRLSIKEIAQQCGFLNQNHFSTWFKKHSNCSPTTFRAQIERK